MVLMAIRMILVRMVVIAIHILMIGSVSVLVDISIVVRIIITIRITVFVTRLIRRLELKIRTKIDRMIITVRMVRLPSLENSFLDFYDKIEQNYLFQ